MKQEEKQQKELVKEDAQFEILTKDDLKKLKGGVEGVLDEDVPL